MNTEKIQEALTEVCKTILYNTENHSAPDWFTKLKDAENTLKAVNDILSFNEYEREKGNPDNLLEDMEYLNEMAQCGGDWSNPLYVLQRAFYGYAYNPHYKDDGTMQRDEFNPNHEYFTFNGYGNLVSVTDYWWAHYWASILDEGAYIEYLECEVYTEELKQIAELLGIEDNEDEDAE
jgi:hypothetical protein